MNTLDLVLMGVLVVFITLGILTLSTYVTGWLLGKFYGKDHDEKERIAAMVAAIRWGGNG